ncbi:MAG: GNAT family N-acetyltransferase [Propionibacteriaceae bacterium]
MRIRTWQPDDEAIVDALLDSEPDSYWLMQRAGTHGISAREDRFAITLVAEDKTGVVGCATMYENLFHPGHWPATVEVLPGRRSEGIGRALAVALAEHCPADRALTVKVRDTYALGMDFAVALGATTYQHCPVPTIDPAAPAVREWAVGRQAPLSTSVVAISDLAPAAVLTAMVDQYLWQHAQWSPMGERDRMEDEWRESFAEADPQLSSATVREGEITALLPVFREGNAADALGETTHRDEPDGMEVFAACLARTLTELDRAGVRAVEFDGHDDDPHFAPLINELPWQSSDPCALLQWRPD